MCSGWIVIPRGGRGWRDSAARAAADRDLRAGQFDAIVLLHHGRSVAFARYVQASRLADPNRKA
jgi:hypothetical protein